MAVLSDSRIVSGSDDNTLRIWDAKSGICAMILEGHSSVSTINVYMCMLFVVNCLYFLLINIECIYAFGVNSICCKH